MSPAAFEALFVAHERALRAAVRRWIHDTEDSAEIVQEAFVRVWKVRERLVPDTAPAYLYRSALNLAASRRRWRRVRSALQHKVGGDAIAGPPEDAVLDGERAAAVRAAMDELPDELRRVVELRDVTELSYAQIATILDIKEGTVGSRRHAALARLRTILAVALAAGVLATLTLRPEATPKPDPVRALLDGVDHPALVGWGRTELREPESIPTSDPTVKMYRVGG